MYRILIADDEGIMLESLRSIISSHFGSACEIETAKTGRAVIEKAETFHPDIVFMDIHMPGINGIQAMKEIRKFNTSALFYIISAYDKFDYAKEAIDLGVEKYLTKPITKKTVTAVVEEAMAKVDKVRKQRSDQLRIQEKLETVIPVVESGFVNGILFQNEMQDVDYYRQLLDIEADYGYVAVVQFGTDYENGRLISSVGMNLKAQTFYPEFRELAKSSLECIIGSLMSNKIMLVIPHEDQEVPYEERIRIVESARALVTRLESRLEARFRIGIGKIHPMEELPKSYREAIRALNDSRSRVVHIEDLQQNGIYDESFPAETEQQLFRCLENGDTDGVIQELNLLFDWMVAHYPNDRNNIRLKVLEYIIWAERIAFDAGAVNYGFSYRKDYLDIAMSFDDYEGLRQWFQEKLTGICRTLRDQKAGQSDSIIKKAKSYIQEHFDRDISLDDVSREVNISPYYFSKIFKEESGENFIEYLTRIRIEKAKEMLENPSLSIKEVSAMSGYADPNYFSRLFKKQTDMTPREYKMRYGK
ncbi:MAG: response regulator [Candidatus Limivivens sp.]|nr:response regulator [Candidatus Limivivens sp.]